MIGMVGDGVASLELDAILVSASSEWLVGSMVMVGIAKGLGEGRWDSLVSGMEVEALMLTSKARGESRAGVSDNTSWTIGPDVGIQSMLRVAGSSRGDK